jgi:asparagine synthase (glutamine-hydrolysing)
MCGIFFYKSNINCDKTILKEYGNRCNHRGPDNTKLNTIYYLKSYMYFMFHRLSINGLNNISDQPLYRNNNILMCNGEIYNYKELAEKYNCSLITGSDCEIILHLYEKLSLEDLCNELDGVFSFVLYDSIKKKICIGHDPFGIRSLYYFHDKETLSFSSEMKCLKDLNKNIDFYPPGSCSIYDINKNVLETKQYYHLNFPRITEDETIIISTINKLLTESVDKRLLTDRPIGCLLSGGLDSSIIASISSKKIKGLKTFSIGLKNSPDLLNASKISKYLNTDHTTIEVTEDQMLDAIERTIYQIESYDITTIRASVPMFLLSEYIRDNTDIKVVLSGEGSDEASGSYLYFHNAPDPESFQNECIRLIKDVQYFDVLRGDKTTSGAGLEIRVPFFDKSFIEYYMSIDPGKKMVRDGMEKYLLRKAFENDLPEDILWRRKDGFSDGVSSFEKPWYEIIEEYAQGKYKMNEKEMYKHIYDKYYQDIDNIPYMWMPKWSDQQNPSNRLINY